MKYKEKNIIYKSTKIFIKLVLFIMLIAVFTQNNSVQFISVNKNSEKNAYLIQEEQKYIDLSEEKIEGNNCNYEVIDNKANIIEYLGNEDSIIIDEEIDGYKIDGIDTGTFSNSDSVEMIKISKSISNVIDNIENFEKNEILSDDQYIAYSTTKEYNKAYLEYIKLTDEEKKKVETIPNKFIVPVEKIYSSQTQSIYQDVKDEYIPSKYDLRNDINVDVKNQESMGICYACATISSAETTLAKTKNISKRFSSVHAAVVSEQGSGGNFDRIYNNCFGKRLGPIEISKNSTFFDINTVINSSNEMARRANAYCTDETSINKTELNELLAEYKRYTPEYCTLRKMNFATIGGDKKNNNYYNNDVINNRNLIKKHIYKYGSVYVHIENPDNSSAWQTLYGVNQLCSNVLSFDHAVSLIGWDDSKQAYLALNSWGSSYGDRGCFWISYNDYNVEEGAAGFVEVDSVSKYLDINKAETKITGNIKKRFKYSGNSVMPSFENLTYDGTECVRDVDYTVRYQNNVNVGNGSVIITGIGNYTGTKELSFTIIPKIINSTNSQINILDNSIQYTGNEIQPDVNIMILDTEMSYKNLVKGKDYDISYENNKNVGKAKIEISGIGNFKGDIEQEFNIDPLIIDDNKNCDVIFEKEIYQYSSEEIKPKIKVKLNDENCIEKDLVENRDYTVEYQNNLNAGKGLAIITGIGNYKGIIKSEFNIKSFNIENCEIKLDNTFYIFNGNEIKPSVTIKNKDKILVEKKDYTISYHNNIDIGKATINIQGIGNYEGIIEKEFFIEEKLNVNINKYQVNQKNDNNYIEMIERNLSVKNIKENIETNGKIEIYNDNKNIIDDNVTIGTGMKITITLGSQNVIYTVIVIGDLNGDGKLDIVDVLKLSRYISNLDKNIGEEFLMASDLVDDRKYATISDLLKMTRVLSNIESL